jgi:hypothetical protein
MKIVTLQACFEMREERYSVFQRVNFTYEYVNSSSKYRKEER